LKFVIAGKFAGLNGQTNAHKVLVNDPAGADIGMADFTVAHLSVGQAHLSLTCMQARMRARTQGFVVKRRVCRINGAYFGVAGDAPTIHDYQNYLLVHAANLHSLLQ
jgi:hypothetical protein